MPEIDKPTLYVSANQKPPPKVHRDRMCPSFGHRGGQPKWEPREATYDERRLPPCSRC
jgi:hypothetical protein